MLSKLLISFTIFISLLGFNVPDSKASANNHLASNENITTNINSSQTVTLKTDDLNTYHEQGKHNQINPEAKPSTQPVKETIDSKFDKISQSLTNINSALEKSTKTLDSFYNDVKSKDSRELNSKLLIILNIFWSVLIIIFFVFTVYYAKKRLAKQDDNFVSFISQNKHFSDDVITKLDLYSNIPLQNIQNTSKFKIEDQHLIVKAIANKLSFMEVTMSKMDRSVRGFKQLAKSISQIKDNLRVYGYEMVDMLGKPYNPGMKLIANFVDDENIPEGQQIITGVVKPQINYRGVMIQSAQITVSQNIKE